MNPIFLLTPIFKSKQNDTGMDDRGELVDVAQMLKALLEDKVRGAKSRK